MAAGLYAKHSSLRSGIGKCFLCLFFMFVVGLLFICFIFCLLLLCDFVLLCMFLLFCEVWNRKLWPTHGNNNTNAEFEHGERLARSSDQL